MKWKKIVCLLMVAAMLVSLTACNNTSEEVENEAGEEDENEASEATEVIELDFWTTGESGDETNTYWVMAQEFNELYEGQIKVNHIGIGGNEDQQQKFQLAAGSDTMPDMMILSAGSFVNEFVSAGVLADMEEYLGGEDFTGRFTAETLDAASSGTYTEDHFWYFPVSAEFSGWYYNKALFDQCGLEIPETWDEFLNCVAVFLENDILPITHGGANNWATWGYYAFFSRYGISTESFDALLSGEKKAADMDEFRKPYERVAELAEAGAYAESVVTTDNTQAWETFAGGGAAMYSCGSWCIGDLDELENSEDFVFSYGPEFSDGVLDKACGMRPFSWVFAFGSCLDEDVAKKEAAATFASWFTDPETNTKYFNEYGTISAAACDTSGELSHMKQVAVEAVSADVIGIVAPCSYAPDISVGTVIDNGITALITQNATVDQVLQDLQDWADRTGE